MDVFTVHLYTTPEVRQLPCNGQEFRTRQLQFELELVETGLTGRLIPSLWELVEEIVQARFGVVE